MNGVGIQCAHCGQTNDFELFCKTNMGIELPKFHYQCPACHAAFKIEKKPAIDLNPSLSMSARMPSLSVVPIQGSL